VRYVLEGSVQRSANRMRVNVQLIDAESGNHLWAVANALNAQLIIAEARRAERIPSPDSMDLYFQCSARLTSMRTLTTRRER
jgi:hypothetical protein